MYVVIAREPQQRTWRAVSIMSLSSTFGHADLVELECSSTATI